MALLTNHDDDRVDLDGVDFAGTGAQGGRGVVGGEIVDVQTGREARKFRRMSPSGAERPSGDVRYGSAIRGYTEAAQTSAQVYL